MCCSQSLAKNPTRSRSMKKRSPPSTKPGQTSGRWTLNEHDAFLEGLKVYGREWKKVANHIPTRTSAQVRSHAQKYFAKIARDDVVMSHEEAPRLLLSQLDSETTALPNLTYTPSVKINVERILSDPSAVESEVAMKMGALRERYRQLQQCLEEQMTPCPPQDRSLLKNTSEDNNTCTTNIVSLGFEKSIVHPQQKKRRRIEKEYVNENPVSSKKLSLLGTEELIALCVLGGSLRKDSKPDSALVFPTVDVCPLETNSSLILEINNVSKRKR